VHEGTDPPLAVFSFSTPAVAVEALGPAELFAESKNAFMLAALPPAALATGITTFFVLVS
jgi:hypothetical protein